MNFKINNLYYLTTEHPTSHYGIPVVVDHNGKAYGPASLLPVPKKFHHIFDVNRNTCDNFIASWVNEYVKDNNGNIEGMSRTKEEVIAASKFLGQYPEGIQIDSDKIFASRQWKLNHKD